jgi:hypothetical protein
MKTDDLIDDARRPAAWTLCRAAPTSRRLRMALLIGRARVLADPVR